VGEAVAFVLQDRRRSTVCGQPATDLQQQGAGSRGQVGRQHVVILRGHFGCGAPRDRQYAAQSSIARPEGVPSLHSGAR